MTWMRKTLEDGEKPSLARQLILGVVAFIMVLIVAHQIAPGRVAELSDKVLDRLTNLLESLMMWAGWSRGVTAGSAAIKAVKNRVSPAPAAAESTKPPAIDPDAGP
jgi:hypothetical protein